MAQSHNPSPYARPANGAEPKRTGIIHMYPAIHHQPWRRRPNPSFSATGPQNALFKPHASQSQRFKTHARHQQQLYETRLAQGCESPIRVTHPNHSHLPKKRNTSIQVTKRRSKRSNSVYIWSRRWCMLLMRSVDDDPSLRASFPITRPGVAAPVSTSSARV